MSAIQAVLHRNNANIINIQNYVVANWSRFYKGQVVTPDARVKNWSTDTLGYDENAVNEFTDISFSFSLSDIPLEYPISTIFYHEYKVEPIESISSATYSSAAQFNPVFGVTTTDKNNFNARPITIFQERHPDPLLAEYDDGIRTTMYSNFGMQIKSLNVAQIENNSKTVIGTKFYQNGFNIQSDSPSVLLLPGFWSRVIDSGATTFTQRYNSPDYTNYYSMDITTSATFSVTVGDLVIATTMLEKHPYTAVDIGDIDLVYSWTRNRTVNGGTAGHGLSLWFSNVDATYNVSRAITDYPASRFVVYRYDPNGRVNRPLPPPPPGTTYSAGGDNWSAPTPAPAPDVYFEGWAPTDSLTGSQDVASGIDAAVNAGLTPSPPSPPDPASPAYGYE
jgi:hypothetical protein